MFIKDLILPWRKPLRRYYIKSIFPGCLAVLIFAIGFNSPQLLVAPWQKLLWILLVLIPFIWTCKIYAQYLIECDEVERKIELDALAVGSFFTLFCCLVLILAIAIQLISPSAKLVIEIVLLSLFTGYASARSYWLWRYLK
ncbi:MAG: hypothetical protein ACREPB_08020 [Arenimonas sp.]